MLQLLIIFGMKRTVKSCCKCAKLFLVINNTEHGKHCKNCSIIVQKKTENKLSEYMEIKFNKLEI